MLWCSRRSVCLAAMGVAFAGSLSAGEPKGLQLDRDDRSFYAPTKFSPVRIVRLKFHPTEPRLFAQVSDRQLAVWELSGQPQKVKGQKDPQVVPAAACEQSNGWIGGFDVHPSGQWIVTGGTDRKLRLWSWSEGKSSAKPALEIQAHDGWIETVAYSPDGRLVASAGNDGRVRVWHADSLKPVEEFTGHKKPIRDLAWSPDGGHLMSGGEDGQILVYNRADKKVSRTLTFGNANEQQGQDPAHSGVFRLACSPDGQWLSVAGQGKFSLFSLKSGQLVASENLSFDTAFHPQGKFLLAGFDTTKVFRFEPSRLDKISLDPSGKTGKATSPAGDTVATLKRNNGYGLAINRDGNLVAAGTGESTVGLWKIAPK